MSMNFGLDANTVRRSTFRNTNVSPIQAVPVTAPGRVVQGRPVGVGFGTSMFQRINVNTTGGGGCGCGK